MNDEIQIIKKRYIELLQLVTLVNFMFQFQIDSIYKFLSVTQVYLT